MMETIYCCFLVKLEVNVFGYHGKLMVVDLNTESWYLDDIQEDVFSRFLGGVGLGAYLLYRYSKPNTDPLDPANP